MDFNFPPHEILKKGGGNMKSKNEQLNRKLEKEKKIKQEMNRVKKLYKDLPKEKVKILEGLIADASFMKIELEEKREYLINNGTTELFEQGPQSFTRERPEFKVYKDLQKLYSNVMKQLIDLMSDKEKKEETDELIEFLRKGKIKK